MANIIEELQKYNHSIKNSLDNGIKFTQLVDTLSNTSDYENLLSATIKLSNYHLDTDHLHYLAQYNNSDYYLIFMERLFKLNKRPNDFAIYYDSNDHCLKQTINSIGKRLLFYFQQDKVSGGAFYKEINQKEPIFYINLKQKIIKFNGRSLTQLFIINNYNDIDHNKIKNVVKIFTNFGKYLKQNYNFNVNLGILNAYNKTFHKFQNKNISLSIIDELFVKSAQHNYMLTTENNNNAKLKLKNDVDINIYQYEDNWGLVVEDTNQVISWFDIILDYNFLREWYINNLQDVEINDYSYYNN